MARVVLENVSKIFEKDVVAVSDATFTVDDREFVVLVGPSGCGKSTTLRMIAGLEEATEGTITIGDRVVNDLPPKDRDIAMVFQNYALYPHMTVFDNMAFALKLRKLPKEEIKSRVQDAADILGITALLERKPRALSGGQRQRVAVGRAIVRDPAAFLFDEPLSNLDAKLRVAMRAEISRLHRRLEATIVYVTHDQVEAMTMGERIVVMKDGIIHQIDTPLMLYNEPVNLFVAGFIGSPAMNIFAGRIAPGDPLSFVSDGLTVNVPSRLRSAVSRDQSVFFGVRPEHLHLSAESLAESAPITCVVDVVEPMGSETYVHARAGDSMLTARLTGSVVPRPTETVALHADLSRAHFFDAETEERLVP
jgi:multiple sugar transport system ATP-binding protein